MYNIGGSAQTFYTPQLGASAGSAFQVDVLPYIGILNPSQPTSLVIQPYGNFAAGTYSDFVNFQFSDGRIQTLKVNVIAGASGSGTTGELRPRDGSTLCVATKLIPALTTLSPAFVVLAGWPVALSEQSMDDCGNPQTAGNVTVSFSNGDPPLALSSLNDGTWQATWETAQSGVRQPVTLNITATNNQLQLTGTSQVIGGSSSLKTPPAITQAGIVSAASRSISFTALAPGSMIAIYGNLLADNAASAPSIPLPTTMANAQVIIAGQAVPLLYVSPTQINAVVPFGLNTNTTYSLLIQRDLPLSSVVPINIADAQPSLFLNSGRAIVQDSRGTAPVFLVTPSAPAQAGDVLVFYCAGLGVTNPPVADGVASPASPTAQGSAVPVLITVAGQTSPASIIATQ